MGDRIEVVVHGRGNAWPVPLGEEHPFYDRHSFRDLSNASFSIVTSSRGRVEADILVDAGHGTIQSLVSGTNRIPDCICLTHGHMDHTLSVDWIVQSYWRRHDKQRLYPVCCTDPVFRNLVGSYPQLEGMVEHLELKPGVTRELEQAGGISVTAFPAYHGKSAVGASMLLFESAGRSVLFTGDMLTPLLRTGDYARIGSPDLLVVDTNNRFPWPRTNHWSLAGHPDDPLKRSDPLTEFIGKITWEELFGPHLGNRPEEEVAGYLDQVRREGSVKQQPFTITEFLKRVTPERVMLVHYSGGEDLKYYNEPLLRADQLLEWSSATLERAGIRTEILIPEAGEVISL